MSDNLLALFPLKVFSIKAIKALNSQNESITLWQSCLVSVFELSFSVGVLGDISGVFCV